MAPSATAAIADAVVSRPKKEFSEVGAYKDVGNEPTYDAKNELEGTEAHNAAKYKHYLPTWNPEQKYPPLTPYEHYDHGKDADLLFKNLLPEGTRRVDLTPTIGTEVTGIQLSTLTKAGKDELARFVAERKVVSFRDQDFADLSIAEALKYGEYFGRHHIHPTSGSPEGYPEIHLVHRGAGDRFASEFFEKRTSSVAWHSDVTYEIQPPATTFLYILDKPTTGGDTIFVNQVEAYKRLSPEFQRRLHGLKATHSGFEQVEASRRRGGVVRRDPIITEHPVIRTHPVTGEKALFINPQFTRDIVGYKKEESDALLKFLYDHIAHGADFQTRVKWEERTVVVWDNRVALHSALVDWQDGQRRHLARITPQGERPFETPFEG